MANVTAGYNWTSGETVTPAKLNSTASPTVVVANDEITTAKILDANVTAAKLAATLDLSSKTVTLPAAIALPAGAVMPFAINSAPTGWLAADGAAVSRSTYATLFAAISTTHGAGDGSTTFNLPDLRGVFVRGSGSQTISGSTYSGTFAQKQIDQNKAHRHFLFNVDNVADTDVSATNHASDNGSTTGSSGLNYQINGSATEPTLGLSSEDGGTEVRVANIALLYCIKF
jgi:microcystin-dependent protein